MRRVDHGLYVRADRFGGGQLAGAPAGARTGPIAADDKQPRLRAGAADRTRSNGEDLVAGFDSYMSSFHAGNPLSGPSVYFHQKAIERRRSHDSVDALLADQQFLEYVHAVLPAWGMHRMGAQRAKVTEYAQLVGSLRATAPSLRKLWPLNICDLEADSVAEVSEQVRQVIAAIRASTSETQIVAGGKVLHHLLPDLVPLSTGSTHSGSSPATERCLPVTGRRSWNGSPTSPRSAAAAAPSTLPCAKARP